MMDFDRPELPFAELPSSWGKTRGQQYAQMAEQYRCCPAHEVHEWLAAIATLLNETPRCPEREVDRAWSILRTWNERCAEHVEPHIGQLVSCPCCGEFRDGALMGEGAVLHHLRPIGRTGSMIHVDPNGCQHHTFVLVCHTCGLRWTDGAPMLSFDAPPADAVTDIPPLTMMNTSPDEYGPN